MSTSISYEQQDLFPFTPPTPRPIEKAGVVYTKPWVVSAILDLSGYVPSSNLVDAVAIEPAAGDGAFVLSLVQRLVVSAKRHDRPLTDCTHSLIAYEIDSTSAERTRVMVVDLLEGFGVRLEVALQLAAAWIRCGDFLAEVQRLPRADFVIGNPPYIRLEDMNDESMAYYRKRYKTMVGRADLYVAFFEAALRQLKPNGVCGYICADRWMLNQYGAELRKFITSGYSVETIIEMHNAEAFEAQVSAYPAISIIRRAPQEAAVFSQVAADIPEDAAGRLVEGVHLARQAGSAEYAHLGFTAARIDTWFLGDEPWPRLSPDRLRLLRYLEANFLPLETQDTSTYVTIGVATGVDDVFITTDPEAVEAERLLPLAMAHDTADGKLAWSKRYLVNPWDENGLVSLGKYPRLQAYFVTHQDKLRGRHIGKKNGKYWYRTIDRVNVNLLRKPKLYIHDIKDVFNPVLDSGETYPHHNLYVIYSDVWDLEVLGGLLLSDIAQFFIECYGVRMRGGYLRFQAQYLRRVHVPDPKALTESQNKALVQAFRTRDRDLASKVAKEVYRVERSLT